MKNGTQSRETVQREGRIIRAALVLAALLIAPIAWAAGENDIRVDVVVDLTDAGRKVPHPTPDKPAYYLPVTVGYKEEGPPVPGQNLPPPVVEVQHRLARALYDQGYRVMNKESPPSLVLVFWWGHIAPATGDENESAPMPATNFTNLARFPATGSGLTGGTGAVVGPESGGKLNANAELSLTSEFSTEDFGNSDEMMSLVAGSSEGQYSIQNLNLLYDQLRGMARSPRHYLMVSAFDFQSAMRHHPVLLWKAHLSTELAGHYFDEVMPALIATGAPWFGRETGHPRLIFAPLEPSGQVLIGIPEVKGFGTATAAPAADKQP